MLSGAVVGALLGGAILDASSQVVLQGSSDVNQPSFEPVTRAALSFLSTLVVGGILIAVAPDYVDRIVNAITDNPVASFAWGFLLMIAFFVIVVLLAITIVGILLVIPLALGAWLVGAAGNALGYIAVVGQFVDSQGQALLLGAAVAGVLALIPVVGGIAGFVVGLLGVGAMFQDFQG